MVVPRRVQKAEEPDSRFAQMNPMALGGVDHTLLRSLLLCFRPMDISTTCLLTL